MLVSCPHCRTRYRFKQERIPRSGGRFRCRRCRHPFVVRVFHPPQRPAPPLRSAAGDQIRSTASGGRSPLLRRQGPAETQANGREEALSLWKAESDNSVFNAVFQLISTMRQLEQPAPSPLDNIRLLTKMYEEKLISPTEFQKKRSEILNRL